MFSPHSTFNVLRNAHVHRYGQGWDLMCENGGRAYCANGAEGLLTTWGPEAAIGPLAGSRGRAQVGGLGGEAPEALGYSQNCRH